MPIEYVNPPELLKPEGYAHMKLSPGKGCSWRSRRSQSRKAERTGPDPSFGC